MGDDEGGEAAEDESRSYTVLPETTQGLGCRLGQIRRSRSREEHDVAPIHPEIGPDNNTISESTDGRVLPTQASAPARPTAKFLFNQEFLKRCS